jgi:nicotinamide phosphoribosyltransferase
MPNYTYPSSLNCDFYKVGHKDQYPNGTTHVYSNFTPRGSRIKGINKVVAFGIQAYVKRWLIEDFEENFFKLPKDVAVRQYYRVIKYTLGVKAPDTSHWEALHDLGYLPIKLRAVKEGTLVPVRVPVFTVESTHDDFYWLTNYLETQASAEIWGPLTTATIAFQYRQILDRYAMETVGNTDFVKFQGHDFSYRGMFGREAAKLGGAGHLLSFAGTDTIPAILFMEEFYNANIENELVGTSVNATEHSVMCAGGKDDEYETYRRLIQDVYPEGILSIVSDTWDLWKVLTEILPQLKNLILDRDGKVVIRPDSGDPVEIICGIDIPDLTSKCDTLEDCQNYMLHKLVDKEREDTPHGEHGSISVKQMFKFQDKYYDIKVSIEWNRYDRQYYYIDGKEVAYCKETTPTPAQLGVVELLWNVFGGTVNEKGFKELDSHIGAIYGDSITLERCEAILTRLKAKGFASTNIVFGIGSFTYQYQTRDTFYQAMKATHVIVDGEERFIQKDPVTDNGTKKSATGRLVVFDSVEGIKLIDNLTIEKQEGFRRDMLEDVFVDGKLVRDESLADIRARVLG